jgi:hypothetical protein
MSGTFSGRPESANDMCGMKSGGPESVNDMCGVKSGGSESVSDMCGMKSRLAASAPGIARHGTACFRTNRRIRRRCSGLCGRVSGVRQEARKEKQLPRPVYGESVG